MEKILEKISKIAKVDIDETYTRPVKKVKRFTKFADTAPRMKNFNHMIDILMLPTTTKDKYVGLLVVDDIGTHAFDIEPLKGKTADEVLEALKKIYKRDIVSMPKYSIATDDGGEFKGIFAKWLYNNSIFHKVGRPDRHTQQAPVEHLNGQLGRLFNGYMNAKEEKTGKTYFDWIDIIDVVRK